MKIAISGKGGVGKTTLSALLAQIYAEAGRNVLAVDADPAPCLAGSGGIGLQLSSSMNILAWPQVTLILIAILITVVVSEWVSAKVRHAII